MAIVTRDSIRQLLNDPRGHEFIQHVVGRACVQLFRRQTDAEQSANTTREHNTVGFSGPDAAQGCLTAKYYLKHGCLQEWQVAQWTRLWKGYPRICKYHRQLNEVAERRQEKEAA